MASAMEARDPRDLLRRCRESDEEAWSELLYFFRQVARRVLNGFPNLTPVEREEAEDDARATLVTEVQRDGLRGTSRGEMVAFVRVVVINSARDIWRRHRPTEPPPPDLGEDGANPAHDAAIRQQLDRARTIIASWPPIDRFVFIMKLNNVSAAAISADAARLYGVSLTTGAVDVKYSRLRAQLRRQCQ